MDKVMPHIDIVRYTQAHNTLWNEFVELSRCSTFLFKRAYLDYNATRFPDHSLLAVRNNKVMALLPATLLPDGTLSSHAGLTYGGWILPRHAVSGSTMLEIFDTLTAYCKANRIKRLDYKPLPHIYATQPSQEDLYALFRFGANRSCVNLSSAIDLRSPWKFDMSKRQQVRKALAAGVCVTESTQWDSFWVILQDCLASRHDATPVHSISEIKSLAENFPGSIRLFTATLNGEIVAGVCIYDTGLVAHSQYAATTADGRRHYALTALYHRLITDTFSNRRYFDFGTSNEDGGRVLNSGLLSQKFSMGATGVAYERYTLNFTS